MKSAITISLIPEARGGPFVFWGDLQGHCRRAAELGFDAVEIFAPAAGELDLALLRQALKDHQVSLAAIGTGAGWVRHKLRFTDPAAETRKSAIDFARALVEAAADLGAPAIIGSMQGRADPGTAREDVLGWLGEALEALGARAAELGTTLLYEPLNRYETDLFNRVEDAWSFAQLLSPAIRILADLFHMNIEEADLAASIRSVGAGIGHVHFADSNRRAIGFGHTDMPPVIQALRETGYTGYLSAEVFPLPDSETAARQTIESFRKYTLQS